MSQAQWTKRSYDALFQWVAGEAQRRQAEQTLNADGFADVVSQLRNAQNLGVWYRLTRVAADAVGSEIVEQSAKEAELELERIASDNPITQ